MLAASLLVGGYAVVVQRPALQGLNDRLQFKTAELATASARPVHPPASPTVDAPGLASSADLALLVNRSAQHASVLLADVALEHDASSAYRGESRAAVRATGSYAQLKRFQALVLNADPRVALLDLSLTKAGNASSRLDARYTFVRSEGGLSP